MSVKAWLNGRPSDLELIAHHFSSGDPAVGRQDNDEYYLTSDSFEPLWDRGGGALYDHAQLVLTYVNGLAYALDPQFRPVQLVSRFTDASGRHQAVMLSAAIEINTAFAISATVSIDGQPQEPPLSPAPGYLRQATSHPDVAEALTILARTGNETGWHDLYKVLEIIRENVGGQQKLITLAWKSRNDISAFTVSANSPGVSGDAARHARLNSGTPQHTMSLAGGRTMIRDLVMQWLKWLTPDA